MFTILRCLPLENVENSPVPFHRRLLAATCSHLQPLAATCSHLQPLAATCSHLQPLAATCPQQPLAATCSHLQPFAPGQVAASGCSSGCKWLQVAAGGKWLQVAAFLKIKKNASCVLNGISPERPQSILQKAEKKTTKGPFLAANR